MIPVTYGYARVSMTDDDSAAAMLFRGMMLARGAYQVESTSERIKAGLERARAEGRKPGRPPMLIPEQARECRRCTRKSPRSGAWPGS